MEHLRLTFEHAPVGIAEMGVTGAGVEPNPEFCAITGLSRENWQKNFAEILYAEGEPRGAALPPTARGRYSYYQEELAYTRADGAAIWLGVTVTLVPESGRSPARAIAVIEDITNRKHAEERIREAQKYESMGRWPGGSRTISITC